MLFYRKIIADYQKYILLTRLEPALIYPVACGILIRLLYAYSLLGLGLLLTSPACLLCI
jgi:hypothetical protein